MWLTLVSIVWVTGVCFVIVLLRLFFEFVFSSFLVLSFTIIIFICSGYKYIYVVIILVILLAFFLSFCLFFDLRMPLPNVELTGTMQTSPPTL